MTTFESQSNARFTLANKACSARRSALLQDFSNLHKLILRRIPIKDTDATCAGAHFGFPLPGIKEETSG